jgi:hypothetical protein
MLVFVLWLVLLAPAYFVPTPSEAELRTIDPARRIELQNDVRSTLLQGLGGLAVLTSVFFTYRQLRIAREGQVTERFTRAIDQLGNDNMDVRLGGIYALERIASDSRQDRATIAEVLTAFVRGHAPWPAKRPGQPRTDMDLVDVPELRAWAADVEAALTVLGRRKFRGLEPDEPEVLDLDDTDLRRANLRYVDLPGATFNFSRLVGADLTGARLQKASLFAAVLDHAHLVEAKLEGARLDRALLAEAELNMVELRRAQLVAAWLPEARLRACFSDRHGFGRVWPVAR